MHTHGSRLGPHSFHLMFHVSVVSDCSLFDDSTFLSFLTIFSLIILPSARQLHVPGCGGQIPCALPPMRTLALLPSTTLSQIIYNRLFSRLDQAQPEDQGGLRRSYQTLDHLATYRLLEQKCQEWCIKIWVATVDFMKAFDSISHQSLWEALEKCGIESNYISLLRRLYAEQKGTVSTDKKSDMFEMKRGTKHGYPLSSVLFNTVLQNGTERRCGTMAKNQKAWVFDWAIMNRTASQTCVLPAPKK